MGQEPSGHGRYTPRIPALRRARKENGHDSETRNPIGRVGRERKQKKKKGEEKPRSPGTLGSVGETQDLV